jgi:hypothetical protein
MMYVGERCSIVTWAPRAASAGTSVIAGRAAADDHDALARWVEVRRPLLRVEDGAGELTEPRQVGREAGVVPVVAGAAHQEATADRERRGAGAARAVHRPPCVGARPADALDAVLEADVAIDAEPGRGLAHVRQDARPVGERAIAGPRVERVAERVHVRVRPHARIAEQVPGAADGLAGLEHGVAGVRQGGLHVVAGGDARQAGPDDEHVEIVVGERGVGRGRRLHGVATVAAAGTLSVERLARKREHRAEAR